MKHVNIPLDFTEVETMMRELKVVLDREGNPVWFQEPADGPVVHNPYEVVH